MKSRASRRIFWTWNEASWNSDCWLVMKYSVFLASVESTQRVISLALKFYNDSPGKEERFYSSLKA